VPVCLYFARWLFSRLTTNVIPIRMLGVFCAATTSQIGSRWRSGAVQLEVFTYMEVVPGRSFYASREMLGRLSGMRQTVSSRSFHATAVGVGVEEEGQWLRRADDLCFPGHHFRATCCRAPVTVVPGLLQVGI